MNGNKHATPPALLSNTTTWSTTSACTTRGYGCTRFDTVRCKGGLSPQGDNVGEASDALHRNDGACGAQRTSATVTNSAAAKNDSRMRTRRNTIRTHSKTSGCCRVAALMPIPGAELGQIARQQRHVRSRKVRMHDSWAERIDAETDCTSTSLRVRARARRNGRSRGDQLEGRRPVSAAFAFPFQPVWVAPTRQGTVGGGHARTHGEHPLSMSARLPSWN